jgi:hypothetical protein
MARVRSDEVIVSLLQAAIIDPGNPAARTDRDGTARKARVAIMDSGRAEVTNRLDRRGKAEGVICYLNPYEGNTNVMRYKDMDAALNDAALHRRVVSEIGNYGGQAINTSSP